MHRRARWALFYQAARKDVAEKIIRHNEALGGLNRVSFQMDTANMQHDKLMIAIELIGTQVISLVKEKGL